MQKSKVAIIGGGVPGLSLALILAEAGIDITLAEQAQLPARSDIQPSGRTAALMQNSLKVLERAGVWPDFKDEANPLARLSVIDDSLFPRGEAKMVRQDFDAGELGYDVFGYNCPLGLLTAILAERVKLHPAITVIEDMPYAPEADFVRGADLIVGADGRESAVRKAVGIDAKHHEYGQSAMTCLISHTRDHEDTSVEFHRSGGPFTYVPYDDKVSAIVWVEKTHEAENFIALPKAAYASALQQRTRGLLGQIDLLTGPECWPLISLKADRLVAPKTALIAEAAHVMSPIGAQGLNLSLRDVEVLADCLIEAVKAKRDIGATTVLKTYERRRRRDIATRTTGIDMLNRMVATDNPIIREVRRFGLRALGHAGPIRHLLMQEGLAPKV